MTLDDAITGILEREGSTFTNDPQDYPTKYGVDLPTYQGFKASATMDDIRNLTEDGARAFYRWYLAPFTRLQVSDRLWTNILDAATLHGITGTVEALQRCVGVDVDGRFGMLTLTGIQQMPESKLIARFVKARLHIMVDDVCRDVTKRCGSAAVQATDLKYLKGGWIDRVIDVAYSE